MNGEILNNFSFYIIENISPIQEIMIFPDWISRQRLRFQNLPSTQSRSITRFPDPLSQIKINRTQYERAELLSLLLLLLLLLLLSFKLISKMAN